MDVVRRVRRAGSGAKTGHAGTLDPLATGVLICCLGKATKWVQQLMDLLKVYEAQVDLSAFTATDDREGERQEVRVQQQPEIVEVEDCLAGFIGEIDQKPPAYSAVHVKGQRAYKLARRGHAVNLGTRRVRIDRIEVLDYHWPIVTIRVACGKGTYIRSIARDMGTRLNTGGHLAGLRRLAIGPYNTSLAIEIDDLPQPLTQADLIDPDLG